jgi:acyl-CoA reductase-like NAD-dependent aldehyde dehydrogenase
MEINAGTVLANSAYSFDARIPMSGRKLSGRNTVFSQFSFRHFYQTKSIQVKF